MARIFIFLKLFLTIKKKSKKFFVKKYLYKAIFKLKITQLCTNVKKI